MNAQEIAVTFNLRRSGRQFRGRCPVHGGSKAPFAVSDGDDGTLLFFCHAGCDQRDILAALRQAGILSDQPAQPRRDIEEPPRRRDASEEPLCWSDHADRIWRQRKPAAGSIAETYLRIRRCAIPAADDLAYLPAGIYGPHPAMVARITDAVTAAPMSLHFTRLQPDGTGKAPIDKAKLLLAGHRKAGGVIRLVDDAEVTTGLGLTEGIETALSVLAMGWSPVWAAIDAGNLAAFPILPGIEALTIFADADQAGMKATNSAADRWRQAGRDASIVTPSIEGNDWNDEAGV